MGAIIGRCANRIGNAEFALNGKIYHLDKNDGNNHLHGGFSGFDKKIWSVRNDSNCLMFTIESCCGEGGYPGNPKVSVDIY